MHVHPSRLGGWLRDPLRRVSAFPGSSHHLAGFEKEPRASDMTVGNWHDATALGRSCLKNTPPWHREPPPAGQEESSAPADVEKNYRLLQPCPGQLPPEFETIEPRSDEDPMDAAPMDPHSAVV